MFYSTNANASPQEYDYYNNPRSWLL